MDRHQRMLVALSESETDSALVSYARLLANLGLARHFHFVHVRTPYETGLDLRPNEDVLDVCESLVARTFRVDRNELSYSCHIVPGPRIDALIEFAAHNQCGTIVLGHRRSRSGQRSLARRLAMVAPCSVWLVPEAAPLTLSNIMVPVDFSDHSADSVELAASLAKTAGAECFAAHVFANSSTIRNEDQIGELVKSEQAAFAKFIAPIDTNGVNVEPYFVEGNNVARSLLHAATQHSADLIVMNTRGRSRAASILLGSVTTQVMVESQVAIFALKHFGAMLNLFQALQQAQIWKRPSPKTN